MKKTKPAYSFFLRGFGVVRPCIEESLTKIMATTPGIPVSPGLWKVKFDLQRKISCANQTTLLEKGRY